MAKNKDKDCDHKVTEQNTDDTSVVYDLDNLWKMKFRNSRTGEISKVRYAFKPRGKLEFYNPDQG